LLAAGRWRLIDGISGYFIWINLWSPKAFVVVLVRLLCYVMPARLLLLLLLSEIIKHDLKA